MAGPSATKHPTTAATSTAPIIATIHPPFRLRRAWCHPADAGLDLAKTITRRGIDVVNGIFPRAAGRPAVSSAKRTPGPKTILPYQLETKQRCVQAACLVRAPLEPTSVDRPLS